MPCPFSPVLNVQSAIEIIEVHLPLQIQTSQSALLTPSQTVSNPHLSPLIQSCHSPVPSNSLAYRCEPKRGKEREKREKTIDEVLLHLQHTRKLSTSQNLKFLTHIVDQQRNGVSGPGLRHQVVCPPAVDPNKCIAILRRDSAQGVLWLHEKRLSLHVA